MLVITEAKDGGSEGNKPKEDIAQDGEGGDMLPIGYAEVV